MESDLLNTLNYQITIILMKHALNCVMVDILTLPTWLLGNTVSVVLKLYKYL